MVKRLNRRLGLLVAAVVTGCGNPSEPDNESHAVRLWTESVNEKDWQEACAITSDPVPASACVEDLQEALAKALPIKAALSSEQPEPFNRRIGKAYTITTAAGDEAGISITAIHRHDGYRVRVWHRAVAIDCCSPERSVRDLRPERGGAPEREGRYRGCSRASRRTIKSLRPPIEISN